jgi:DNA-binding NtrC family response regulator
MSLPKTIYIIDDDPVISRLLAKRLTAEGYIIKTFDYGEDCLEAMYEKPDLVILDYLFSKSGSKVMNGMEIFDRIKKADKRIPVIMLSGQGKGDIVLEFARKGIEDYIIKDNNLIDNLLGAIKELFTEAQ